ncbi:uncharacterized protein GLRG_04824 [Colletotrichum graminicola M1.001]|uniref:Uncharacterized protein n=1 Tax=Colletotrichum graminicola (strain M1.001 / M2 / FGSC 10212) TaxID=645133 RepID=E3QG84_COLGM|nr:uncharacterized protein GLRG_04824 [Colletotrichum graminicola M1.001]EFQ29680.1 hypothetical protein GLRG_04824 [Colletotrichum graminicola M1.001]
MDIQTLEAYGVQVRKPPTMTVSGKTELEKKKTKRWGDLKMEVMEYASNASIARNLVETLMAPAELGEATSHMTRSKAAGTRNWPSRPMFSLIERGFPGRRGKKGRKDQGFQRENVTGD